MSPSALEIHLKSILFHKCCRNLCVRVPRCVHDTFSHFWRIPTHLWKWNCLGIWFPPTQSSLLVVGIVLLWGKQCGMERCPHWKDVICKQDLPIAPYIMYSTIRGGRVITMFARLSFSLPRPPQNERSVLPCDVVLSNGMQGFAVVV
jgi:hypothetical protein